MGNMADWWINRRVGSLSGKTGRKVVRWGHGMSVHIAGGLEAGLV